VGLLRSLMLGRLVWLCCSRGGRSLDLGFGGSAGAGGSGSGETVKGGGSTIIIRAVAGGGPCHAAS
jgi:hypothetical protein